MARQVGKVGWKVMGKSGTTSLVVAGHGLVEEADNIKGYACAPQIGP